MYVFSMATVTRGNNIFVHVCAAYMYMYDGAMTTVAMATVASNMHTSYACTEVQIL